MTKFSPCLCLAALLLIAAGPLSAQSPASKSAPPALPNPIELELKYYDSYLAPLLILRPRRTAYADSALWRDAFFDDLSTKESFIGNNREAIADFDARRPPEQQASATEAKAALRGYSAVDARQAILSLTSSRQAVFINEAHHVPMTRAFTLSLLRGLYAQGFRYFAAETLNDERENQDPGLQARGYPVQSTSYYTREPVFGDLIRTAIKLGFKVVPYEYRGPQSPDPIVNQNLRERGEAQNLYDRIFKHDPKAKVLVHAGYGHIAKTSFTVNFAPGNFSSKSASGTVTMMALWFERISKIVLLTIDQSIMLEHSASAYERSDYQAALAGNLIQDKPFVLKNKLGNYFAESDDPSAYDLFVFHPHTLYQFGRPTWLSEDGQRQAYILPSDLGIPANTPALVQAFYANEDAKIAVPIDQIEVKPGLNPLPALMLPAGRFHLRVVDGTGKVLRDWQVDRTGATP